VQIEISVAMSGEHPSPRAAGRGRGGTSSQWKEHFARLSGRWSEGEAASAGEDSRGTSVHIATSETKKIAINPLITKMRLSRILLIRRKLSGGQSIAAIIRDGGRRASGMGGRRQGAIARRLPLHPPQAQAEIGRGDLAGPAQIARRHHRVEKINGNPYEKRRACFRATIRQRDKSIPREWFHLPEGAEAPTVDQLLRDEEEGSGIDEDADDESDERDGGRGGEVGGARARYQRRKKRQPPIFGTRRSRSRDPSLLRETTSPELPALAVTPPPEALRLPFGSAMETEDATKRPQLAIPPPPQDEPASIEITSSDEEMQTGCFRRSRSRSKDRKKGKGHKGESQSPPGLAARADMDADAPPAVNRKAKPAKPARKNVGNKRPTSGDSGGYEPVCTPELKNPFLASDSEDELHRDPLTKIYEDIERSSSGTDIQLNKYKGDGKKVLRKKSRGERGAGPSGAVAKWLAESPPPSRTNEGEVSITVPEKKPLDILRDDTRQKSLDVADKKDQDQPTEMKAKKEEKEKRDMEKKLAKEEKARKGKEEKEQKKEGKLEKEFEKQMEKEKKELEKKAEKEKKELEKQAGKKKKALEKAQKEQRELEKKAEREKKELEKQVAKEKREAEKQAEKEKKELQKQADKEKKELEKKAEKEKKDPQTHLEQEFALAANSEMTIKEDDNIEVTKDREDDKEDVDNAASGYEKDAKGSKKEQPGKQKESEAKENDVEGVATTNPDCIDGKEGYNQRPHIDDALMSNEVLGQLGSKQDTNQMSLDKPNKQNLVTANDAVDLPPKEDSKVLHAQVCQENMKEMTSQPVKATDFNLPLQTEQMNTQNNEALPLDILEKREMIENDESLINPFLVDSEESLEDNPFSPIDQSKPDFQNVPCTHDDQRLERKKSGKEARRDKLRKEQLALQEEIMLQKEAELASSANKPSEIDKAVVKQEKLPIKDSGGKGETVVEASEVTLEDSEKQRVPKEDHNIAFSPPHEEGDQSQVEAVDTREEQNIAQEEFQDVKDHLQFEEVSERPTANAKKNLGNDDKGRQIELRTNVEPNEETHKFDGPENNQMSDSQGKDRESKVLETDLKVNNAIMLEAVIKSKFEQNEEEKVQEAKEKANLAKALKVAATRKQQEDKVNQAKFAKDAKEEVSKKQKEEKENQARLAEDTKEAITKKGKDEAKLAKEAKEEASKKQREEKANQERLAKEAKEEAAKKQKEEKAIQAKLAKETKEEVERKLKEEKEKNAKEAKANKENQARLAKEAKEEKARKQKEEKDNQVRLAKEVKEEKARKEKEQKELKAKVAKQEKKHAIDAKKQAAKEKKDKVGETKKEEEKRRKQEQKELQEKAKAEELAKKLEKELQKEQKKKQKEEEKQVEKQRKEAAKREKELQTKENKELAKQKKGSKGSLLKLFSKDGKSTQDLPTYQRLPNEEESK